MAADRPGSLDDLANMLGIGEYKLKTFGLEFLGVIGEYSGD